MTSGNLDPRRVSRRLSYVLRHDPDSIGVALDAAGWVTVTDLLAGLQRHGLRLSRLELEQVVASSEKQRFAFDPTGTLIRANQGHSVPVDLGLEPVDPPNLLYHGTTARFVEVIRREGLRPRGRHHVHLSSDVRTARAVGARRGSTVVLTVDAAGLSAAGTPFYRSANGVWLVDAVPPDFLSAPPTGRTSAPPTDV
jgi:putative RNA 2'-phosphotransferase